MTQALSVNTKLALTIQPIRETQWRIAKNIQLEKSQRKYVPSVEKLQREQIFQGDGTKKPFAIYGVWLDASTIIGVFTIEKMQDGYMWLGGLQIDQQWQGHGFARRVLEGLIRHVIDHPELKGMKLDVFEENTPVYDFYRRLGFEEIEIYYTQRGDKLCRLQLSREHMSP
ncbi:GNAT family N-acetyltransferase [Algicola sagamiensis]|uniref:GNAT family N-acetyltransferase n=1 Tax=Algicola sagamiensis TaxID=163869 RepID=UPI0003696C47|nr:GNAT family N-acetyltransferase [Algicola sagamiensis]